MSDDILECDACGQRVKKFHRRYRNMRYCQSCYVFFFRKVMCPECGDLARLHTEFPLSVCNRCEKAKPCVRCGRKGYRLGKLTIYGPVCNACSYWFRESRLCSQCGKLSRLLSHSSRSGHGGQICPTCVRGEHRCCSECGRYRELVKSSDGREVCKRCLELGEIKCANCGAMMPAGYGKTCEECHWRAIFSKHRVTNLALFHDNVIACEYDAFCGWLGNRQSYRKCGTLADRYCLPFLRLENTSKQHADWHTLFRRFSPGEMRKYPLLERWLRVREPELSLNVTKQVSAEEHYIKNIIARGDCLKARDVVRQYAGLLEQRRAGGTQYRTVRMALSSAVALLEFSIRSVNGVDVLPVD